MLSAARKYVEKANPTDNFIVLLDVVGEVKESVSQTFPIPFVVLQ